jgi:hypothetical protein
VQGAEPEPALAVLNTKLMANSGEGMVIFPQNVENSAYTLFVKALQKGTMLYTLWKTPVENRDD